MTDETNRLLEQALQYAERGWPVFPLAAGTKVPAIPKDRGGHGYHDATLDEAQIRSWWIERPNANIGISVGACGLAVPDFDPRKGGREAYDALVAKHGRDWARGVPRVRTPGQGIHLYFRGAVPSKTDLIPGLDLKSIGGYVAAPPSRRPDGDYVWRLEPNGPIPELPSCLADLIDAPRARQQAIRSSDERTLEITVESGDGPIPAGRRNTTLASLAGAMRRKGMTESAIDAALQIENAGRCVPPLPREEVTAIATSIARYAPESVLTVLDGQKFMSTAAPVPNGANPEGDPISGQRNTDHLRRSSGKREVVRTRLSDVKARNVKWLWRDRLPLGKLADVAGDPGLGKSTLQCDIIARVTRGDAMPDGTRGDLFDRPRHVIIITAEDDLADTIRPRLEATGADLELVEEVRVRVDDVSEEQPELPLDVAAIEALVEETGAALVVVDPLMAHLGEKVDSHRDHHVRRALAPLSGLAERTGALVWVVRHLNKGSGGSALYRAGASIGISAAVRASHVVAPDPKAPERRVFACVKVTNGRPVPSLSYHLVPAVVEGDGETIATSRVEWLGDSEYTADDLLGTSPSDAGEENRKRPSPAVKEAMEFLKQLLADGPLLATTVKADAEAAGISPPTLNRAMERLGVGSDKEGLSGPWIWKLPEVEVVTVPVPDTATELIIFEDDPNNGVRKSDHLRDSASSDGRMSEFDLTGL